MPTSRMQEVVLEPGPLFRNIDEINVKFRNMVANQSKALNATGPLHIRMLLNCNPASVRYPWWRAHTTLQPSVQRCACKCISACLAFATTLYHTHKCQQRVTCIVWHTKNIWAVQAKKNLILCQMCGFPSCSCRLCNWHKQHEQPMKTKPRWGHSYSCHLRGKGKVREMAHDVREAHLHVVVANVYCNLMYLLTRVFAIIRPFVFFTYIYIYTSIWFLWQACSAAWAEHGIDGVPVYSDAQDRFTWEVQAMQEIMQCCSPICNFIANWLLVVCWVGTGASATMAIACHVIALMFAHAYMNCCSADLHTTCCIAVSPYDIQHAGPRNFSIIHPIEFGYEFGER